MMGEELGAPRGGLAESDGELGGVALVKICVVGAAFGVEFGQLGNPWRRRPIARPATRHLHEMLQRRHSIDLTNARRTSACVYTPSLNVGLCA